MRVQFIILFCLIAFVAYPQTETGKVGDWNYIATLPANYDSTLKYPTVIFFPGLGEVGTDINKLKLNGVHAYNNVASSLPGFIIFSLQPLTSYPTQSDIISRINCLEAYYAIDKSKVNLTGLSHGGWCSITAVQWGAIDVNTITTVEGVQPTNASFFPDTEALKNCNSFYLCFEQKNDYRKGDYIVNYLNSKLPGQATYITTNFGNGGHCCWGNFYGNGNTEPDKFSELGNKNIYEFLVDKNKGVVLGINTIDLSRLSNALIWKVDDESDVIYYEVQETSDGINFKTIKTILKNGKGYYQAVVD